MAKLVIDDEVGNAWGRLTQESSDVSWIMTGYPPGSTSQLIFKAEGSGGFPEFCSGLPADDVVWAAFKVVGVDDRGNTVSRRPKFIFLKWAPEGAAAMRKARAGGHKGAVKQVMNAHIDMEAENLEELTEDVIIAKLRACGGAHQPTSYEFSNFSPINSSTSGKH